MTACWESLSVKPACPGRCEGSGVLLTTPKPSVDGASLIVTEGPTNVRGQWLGGAVWAPQVSVLSSQLLSNPEPALKGKARQQAGGTQVYPQPPLLTCTQAHLSPIPLGLGW